MRTFFLLAWFITTLALGDPPESAPSTSCESDQAALSRGTDIYHPHYPQPVQDILKWVGDHAHLDVPIIPIADGSPKIVPTLSKPSDIRIAQKALESPYDRLLLVTAHPEAFEKVGTLQRDLARDILKQHLTDPPARLEGADALEEMLGAMSALLVSGTAIDLKLLQPPGKWGQWLPHTFAEVHHKLEHQSKPRGRANAREIREFAEAIFKDLESNENIPDLKFHTDHSRRVAKLALKMIQIYRARKGLAALTDAQIDDLTTAGIVHDIGKVYWTKDLVAKRSRLSAADKKRVIEHIKGSELLTPQEKIRGEQAVEDLTAPISTETPLIQFNPEHSLILSRLVKLGVITKETRWLLKEEEIKASDAERSLFNTHYGGYRILNILDPGGISAKTAQSHHERLHGLGYPFELDANSIGGSGDDVTWVRALSVADVYDAMTEPRPNTPVPKSRDTAIGVLARSVEEFDPDFVQILEEVTKPR